jgi:hypothetical protein
VNSTVRISVWSVAPIRGHIQTSPLNLSAGPGVAFSGLRETSMTGFLLTGG